MPSPQEMQKSKLCFNWTVLTCIYANVCPRRRARVLPSFHLLFCLTSCSSDSPILQSHEHRFTVLSLLGIWEPGQFTDFFFLMALIHTPTQVATVLNRLWERCEILSWLWKHIEENDFLTDPLIQKFLSHFPPVKTSRKWILVGSPLLAKQKSGLNCTAVKNSKGFCFSCTFAVLVQ